MPYSFYLVRYPLLYFLARLTNFPSVVIKYVKNRPRNDTSSASPSESESLLSSSSQDTRPPPKAHTSTFDLGLARFSILVDIGTFAILPFAPTGIVFILFTTLGSFGAGLQPAVHSVALELYTRKIRKGAPLETGKLFGALSVVQSVL